MSKSKKPPFKQELVHEGNVVYTHGKPLTSWCSFCGHGPYNHNKIFAARNGTTICDKCVKKCKLLLNKEKEQNNADDQSSTAT